MAIRTAVFSMLACVALGAAWAERPADWRNLRSGWEIPSQNYADQPYIVKTRDGNWLCTLTTGPGLEGKPGQHVVATLSEDRGRTWSPLVDIEPSDGPEASWVISYVAPYGRVYAFYDFNGDRLPPRADMLGWYVYKYSDDHGRTWSEERYRLPMRVTACDRGNKWNGEVQIFWGICQPITANEEMYFSFTKLGKYMLDLGEGWVFHSNNIATEKDPARLHWEMLPDGEHGIRNEELGSIQEEHNIVHLGGDDFYCMYRTTTGYPAHSYSRDACRSWSVPVQATYTPGGRRMKNPRACPRVWRTKNGRYLFWFHNHSGQDFRHRNPVWISGGIERDGFIHWSQPEILLYDDDLDIRISYPGLLQERGEYYFSETQKEVARVHQADRKLLEGLWEQDTVKRKPRKGLAAKLDAEDAAPGAAFAPGALSPLDENGGTTLSLWLRLEDYAEGRTLIDGMDAGGKGVALTTAGDGALRILLSDGRHQAAWTSDAGLLQPGQWHHVAFVADGGPDVITVVIDDRLCDGGEARQYGWGRIPHGMTDISGSKQWRVGDDIPGAVGPVRVYRRYLTTTECIGLWRAG